MAQQVKDLALSFQWLGLLLWLGFDTWPRYFCIAVGTAKKKKKSIRHFKQWEVILCLGL